MAIDDEYIDPEFIKESTFMEQFPEDLIVSLGNYSFVFHWRDSCRGLDKALEIRIINKHEALLMGRRPCEFCWPQFHWQNQYRDYRKDPERKNYDQEKESQQTQEFSSAEPLVPGLEIGQKVTIIDGPYSTLPATIKSIDGKSQKVEAVIELFGLEIQVDVGFAEVGPFYEG